MKWLVDPVYKIDRAEQADKKWAGEDLPPILIGNPYLFVLFLVFILDFCYHIILDGDLHAVYVGDSTGFLDLAVAV